MKYIRILLTVAFGIIYLPVNNLYIIVQTWYLKIKKEDEITYYLFTPIYWVLFVVTIILSIPYQMVAKDLH